MSTESDWQFYAFVSECSKNSITTIGVTFFDANAVEPEQVFVDRGFIMLTANLRKSSGGSIVSDEALDNVRAKLFKNGGLTSYSKT